MMRNPGHCPPAAIGKRVRVRLADGTVAKSDWAADGRSGCRWTRTGSPFHIDSYEVIR